MTVLTTFTLTSDLFAGALAAMGAIALGTYSSRSTSATDLPLSPLSPTGDEDHWVYPLAHIIGAELDDPWLPTDAVEIYDPVGEGDCWLTSTHSVALDDAE